MLKVQNSCLWILSTWKNLFALLHQIYYYLGLIYQKYKKFGRYFSKNNHLILCVCVRNYIVLVLENNVYFKISYLQYNFNIFGSYLKIYTNLTLILKRKKTLVHLSIIEIVRYKVSGRSLNCCCTSTNQSNRTVLILPVVLLPTR